MLWPTYFAEVEMATAVVTRRERIYRLFTLVAYANHVHADTPRSTKDVANHLRKAIPTIREGDLLLSRECWKEI